MVSILYPILASLIVSVASLVGILLLKSTKRTILFLVSFSTGVFLGATFIHIFPKISTINNGFLLFLISFIVFIIIEEIFHWHHHEEKRHIGIINLIGDFVHNFVDGLGIASAFKIDFYFGWLFTFMILAHEIPQELGDFGVLIYSGFSRYEALLLNFLVALSSIIGVIFGWYIKINPLYLLSIVGGSFLYLATVDLIPILREEIKGKDRIIAFFIFLLGISFMYLIKILK